jgi:O-antigen biosynthesis protein
MPRFSVVTPVFDPPVDALVDSLQSLANQTFVDWEHCLVDDASTNAEVRRVLDEAAANDDRMRLVHRVANGGIGIATNEALAMATGDFIVFLDHDDTISSDALADVARLLDAAPDTDLLYTDEDKLFADGTFGDWFAKPAWSPERFRGQNYLCHLAVVRRALLDRIGGCRPGFDGSQDYDLLLRASEQARRITHLPRFVYHWRVVPGSTAGDSQAKPAAYEAGRRAITDHCERVGIDATVTALAQAPGCYEVARTPATDVPVTVVVPVDATVARIHGVSGNRSVATLSAVLESVPADTPLVASVAANTPTEIVDELQALGGGRLRVVTAPVNRRCELINRGILAAGTALVAVVDGVAPLTPGWLAALAALATGPASADVAAVGGMMLRADGRIESAGIHVGGGAPVHDGHLLATDNAGPFGRFLITREVGALSFACVLLRREAVLDVGGLHTALSGIEADADLGCKLQAAGHRVLWTPRVQARRLGVDNPASATQGRSASEGFRRRWTRQMARDPFDPAGPALGRDPRPASLDVTGSGST